MDKPMELSSREGQVKTFNTLLYVMRSQIVDPINGFLASVGWSVACLIPASALAAILIFCVGRGKRVSSTKNVYVIDDHVANSLRRVHRRRGRNRPKEEQEVFVLE